MSVTADNIARTIAAENRASAGVVLDADFAAHDRIAATRAALREVHAKLGNGFALPWSLGMILVGMVSLAACVLVPLHEENRQLEHELAGVQAEAKFVDQQADANAEFVDRVHSDPALAERLTMRATRKPTPGKKFLDPEQVTAFSASPYALVQVAPPPEQPAYRSDLPPAVVGLFTDVRSRAVMIGASLFLVAAAVVLGKSAGPHGSIAE